MNLKKKGKKVGMREKTEAQRGNLLAWSINM